MIEFNGYVLELALELEVCHSVRQGERDEGLVDARDPGMVQAVAGCVSLRDVELRHPAEEVLSKSNWLKFK